MRLSYPVLGLAYSKGQVFVCGGGGSAKTGVNNTVDVYDVDPRSTIGKAAKADSPNAFTKSIASDTGTNLVSGICLSADASLAAASVGPLCWLFAKSKDGKSLDVILKFRSDFAEFDSEQSVVALLGNSTLITGGQDGVVRVWRISRNVETAKKTAVALDAAVAPTDMPVGHPKIGDEAYHDKTSVQLVSEYTGHSKRIKAIAVDSFSRNLIASSAEDQTCSLWRLIDGKAVCKLDMDVAIAKAQLNTPNTSTKYQFRCLRFSDDGRTFYTVLSPPRGASLVAKWIPTETVQVSDDIWEWQPHNVEVIFPEPAASLATSRDGRYIAIGSASGFVKILSAQNLQFHHECYSHDFAVTGLEFISTLTDEKTLVTYFLASAGADKKLYCHYIPPTVAPNTMSRMVGSLSLICRLFISVIFGLISSILCMLFGVLCLNTHSGFFTADPWIIVEDLLAQKFDLPDVQAAIAVVFLAIIVAFVVMLWNLRSSSSIMGANAFGWLINSFLVLLFLIPAALFPQPSWTFPGIEQDDGLGSYVVGVCSGAIALLFLLLHVICRTFSK